jgi:hypothetical protein
MCRHVTSAIGSTSPTDSPSEPRMSMASEITGTWSDQFIKNPLKEKESGRKITSINNTTRIMPSAEKPQKYLCMLHAQACGIKQTRHYSTGHGKSDKSDSRHQPLPSHQSVLQHAAFGSINRSSRRCILSPSRPQPPQICLLGQYYAMQIHMRGTGWSGKRPQSSTSRIAR